MSADDSVRRVLETMAHLATGPLGSENAAVREAMRGLDPKTIGAWIDAHVVYDPDPTLSECVLSPEGMLQSVGEHGNCWGDADDVATLKAAAWRSVGMEVRFVVVGFDGRPYTHVYALAKHPGEAWGDPLAGAPFAGRVTSMLVKDL